MKILSNNALNVQIKYIKGYLKNKIKQYVSVFDGNINGNIIFHNGDLPLEESFIRYDIQPTDPVLQIGYGNLSNFYQNGAKIELHTNKTDGHFTLNAIQDITTYHTLTGKTDSLTWNEEFLCTYVNIKDV